MPPSFSLVARDVARSFGGHAALDGVDLTISPRTRVGVVGPNGSGKTTLLRVMAGLDRVDRGAVTRTPPTLRVGYLAQEAEHQSAETMLVFLARCTGVAAAEAGLERAAHALSAHETGSDDQYAAALERYLNAGGPDFDARAAAVCADLGLAAELLDQETVTLSGGQAARAALAAILLSTFDVLLLDEPTNDLDFDGLDRLERFLGDVPGGVAIVSHDRAFLERTVSSVLELDEHTHRATEYAGGFTAYLEARELARRQANREYEEYRHVRARLEARARAQRDWAEGGVRRAKKDDEADKFIRGARIRGAQQLGAKAKVTERALERLEPVEKPWQGWQLHLAVAGAPRSGELVARLAGAVVPHGAFTLGPVDLEVRWAERVAIAGPNGAGKTTLLQALLGRLPLVRGAQQLGRSVVVGDMDQARLRFAGETPLVNTFMAATGLRVADARSMLAKFGLAADHVLRPAATLSPGERTRAVLALFAARGVNCLVLDEPTNHLDLPAIEQLEEALETYDGTLLLVTHDRRLLDEVRITRTVAVGGGRIIRDEPAGEYLR
jgi:ATPase subunit of ABC transporter with duplicated ATPase domains